MFTAASVRPKIPPQSRAMPMLRKKKDQRSLESPESEQERKECNEKVKNLGCITEVSRFSSKGESFGRFKYVRT